MTFKMQASQQPEGNNDDNGDNDTLNAPDIPDDIRQQVISDYLEQEAIDEFKQVRPDMWLQVQRVGRILELQEQLHNENPEEANVWPKGSCFIHTNTPTTSSFCVEQVLEIDLETCTTTVSIYAFEELVKGTVVLPLESISWIGFPENVNNIIGFTFKGFTAG